MIILLIYWLLFFLVALSDIKEHKIPNKLLLIAIGVRFGDILLELDSSVLISSLTSGVLLFSAGFALFLLRAMSPGDVKLLFVVGFCTNVQKVMVLGYWIILSGGIVATIYFFYQRALSPTNDSIIEQFKSKIKEIFYFVLTAKMKKSSTTEKHLPSRYGDKLVMPFAPSIVIGMAMFYYFN
ncbi:prepilin peptidase [Vibrio breoganii]|uniref:A24 family peptidase n=1 Tax=Vibrio breoganii TaxID=553239 RepID=UPI00035D7395|nr:prepilin peptidase [Vibrio breoganii]OED91754.1 hypothetical protein A1QE_16860 [Vibrio breoganii ZF-55]